MNKPEWTKLVELRMKELNLLQADLVNIFEVKTAGAIGHYFNGRREPSMKGMVKLAKLIDIPLTKLLGLDEPLTKIEFSDSEHITNAIKILSRSADLTPDELSHFFNAFEKIGARNILAAANELSNAGNDSSDQVSAILHILDLAKAKKIG